MEVQKTGSLVGNVWKLLRIDIGSVGPDTYGHGYELYPSDQWKTSTKPNFDKPEQSQGVVHRLASVLSGWPMMPTQGLVW